MAPKEGASVTRPPLLEQGNYAFWKARMRVFISALDDQAWNSVVTQYVPPAASKTEGSSTTVSLKPYSQYMDDEHKAHVANSKALNAIFTAVDEGQFKMISNCETAKEAWDILQVYHEGTNAVRDSKLQYYTTKFEDLKMGEDETVAEFNGRVRDIANKSFQFGKKLKDQKLVRKVLRALPRRFNMKVTAIYENGRMGAMTLDELMGSLEMEMFPTKAKKEMAFASINTGIPYEKMDAKESDEIANITRNFSRFMKKVGKKPQERASGRPLPQNPSSTKYSQQGEPNNPQLSKFKSTNPNLNRKLQCRECEGYGHIQSECANTLKRQENLTAPC